MACQHLGRGVGLDATASETVTIYDCDHPAHTNTTLAACQRCEDLLPRVDEPPQQVRDLFPQEKKGRHPRGVIVNALGEPVNLGDHFLGATAFAVLGGPSARQLPLDLLTQRGVLIFSTNNCPAILPEPIRPHVWIHTDPTFKFSESIWRDPAVMKFSPVREWAKSCPVARPDETYAKKGKKWRNPNGVRTRAEDGHLEYIPGFAAKDWPGVFGYHRNTVFQPNRWLWESTINRGNDKKSAYGDPAKGKQPNGWPHVINTMFSLLRLAFYLGVTRLFLVGCDFHMRLDRQYAFDQSKWAGGVRSNNETYANMCAMLQALKPHFDKHGFTVLNCSPRSHCWVFDYCDFNEAVEIATADVPQHFECKGWYDDVKPYQQ